jgi:integrase
VVVLPWSETDLDNGTLTVTETRSDAESDPSDPKSEYGRRTISLDDDTVRILTAWRKRQTEERLAYGPGWVDSGLVFAQEDGSALRPSFVSEHFKTLLGQAKLPPIRFHDLRHGAATLALAAGVPMKVVSDTLGHATTAFTGDIYTSVIPEVAREAAEAVAAIAPRANRQIIPIHPRK